MKRKETFIMTFIMISHFGLHGLYKIIPRFKGYNVLIREVMSPVCD